MSGSVCPSRRQVDAIVEAAHARGRDDFALLVHMLAWSGLRFFEAAQLEPHEVTFTGAVARVKVRGKRLAGDSGPRLRTALLYEPGLSAVRAEKMRILEAKHPRRLLLVNELGLVRGGMWTRDYAAEQMRECCALAGVEGVTLHGLRKFFGSWLLDQGVSEIDVAVALGHFKRDGRPHVELVRSVYGWPSVPAALERLEAVA